MSNGDYVTIGSVDVDGGSYWYDKIIKALKDAGFKITENPYSPIFKILVNKDEFYAGGDKYDPE